MDILPSGSIFRELQDIQDTGYFSSQVSIEDQWQQASVCFFSFISIFLFFTFRAIQLAIDWHKCKFELIRNRIRIALAENSVAIFDLRRTQFVRNTHTLGTHKKKTNTKPCEWTSLFGFRMKTFANFVYEGIFVLLWWLDLYFVAVTFYRLFYLY